jgi:hypothetical protein
MKTIKWVEGFVGLGLVVMACGPRPDHEDPGGNGGTSQGGSAGTGGQGTSGCGVSYTLKDGGTTAPPTRTLATPSLAPSGLGAAGAGVSDPNNLELCLSVDELAALRDADAGAQPEGDASTCPQVMRREYPNFPAPWVRWGANSAGVKDGLCCYAVAPSCS